MVNKLYYSYQQDKARTCTLGQYEMEAQSAIDHLRVYVEGKWRALADAYRLTPQQSLFAQGLERAISGRALMAYALTELMPSHDSELNVMVMNFLLRTAGSDFVERIPAIHDTQVSFGPYQLTPFALNARTDQGASKIDALTGAHALPQKVEDVVGIEHHEAAYFFAVANIVEAAKSRYIRDGRRALELFNQQPDNLVAFISAAHHAPILAKKALHTFLAVSENREARRALEHYRCSHHLTYRQLHAREMLERHTLRHVIENDAMRFPDVLRSPNVAEYARRSIMNFDALSQETRFASVRESSSGI